MNSICNHRVEITHSHSERSHYGDYGVLPMSSLGVVEAYEGRAAEDHSAFAFHQLDQSLPCD